jgi:hypothetical protein
VDELMFYFVPEDVKTTKKLQQQLQEQSEGKGELQIGSTYIFRLYSL